MKTKSEIRAKKAMLKEKNSIRQVGKTPEKVKKGPTGELELFKKIAMQRSYIYSENGDRCVHVPHIDKNGFCEKMIDLNHLTPTNFSHIKPKGMYPELRLDPDNIEIVSRAYHEYLHTGQIAQKNYVN